MSMGFEYAPVLISVGVLAIAIVIVLDDYVHYKLENYIHKKWVRILIYSMLIMLCVPAYFLSSIPINQQKEALSNTPIFYGNITQGNKPNPEFLSSYTIPNNSIAVILGDKVGVFMRKDQNDIIANQNVPIVSINFNSDGVMLINADIYDKNSNRVLKVKDSAFQADPTYAFQPKQPNNHSLIVNDSDGNEVFKIDYINSGVISISGRFYITGYSEPFLITPNSNINFDGFHVNDTKPFMFDMTKNPNSAFLNITDKGGVSVGGNVIGEGTAK